MTGRDENIHKYTKLPDGKIVEEGPMGLGEALREVERLEISEVSEEGIATPTVGFGDEGGAIMEFTRVNSDSWQVDGNTVKEGKNDARRTETTVRADNNKWGSSQE